MDFFLLLFCFRVFDFKIFERIEIEQFVMRIYTMIFFFLNRIIVNLEKRKKKK